MSVSLFRQEWVKQLPQATNFRYLFTTNFLCVNYHGGASTAKSFLLLGVEQRNCSEEEIKKAYITLVKKYHPDSKSTHASAERFAQVRDAYKKCIAYCKRTELSRDVQEALERELSEIDKKMGFTAKQHRTLPHRHYLTHDVGPGTPSERQKAYSQHRLNEAMDNVYEKQFQKALENPDEKGVGPLRIDHWALSSKVTRTTEMIANEMIRESMSRGGFKRLRGQGRPLRMETNSPILDILDMKLNEILRNAGFAPEWIMQDKEIRSSIESLEKQITICWNKYGPHPMSIEKSRQWEDHLSQFRTVEKGINKKIDSFNLNVPVLNRQRAHMKLEVLINNVCSREPVRAEVEPQSTSQVSTQDQTGNPLTYFLSRVVKWIFGSSW